MVSSDSNLTIRAADVSDFDAVAELFHHLNPKDIAADDLLKRKTFEQLVKHPGLTVLVAWKGAVPVGSCTLVVVPNMTRGCASYALIENVVTREDWRGQGVGKKVLAEAIRLGWQAGCFKIMLMSGSENTEAHKFYESLGFKTSKKGFELRANGYPKREIT
ncbi:GNAT family N-acetyltransferase [uncultured Roseibium sp.]|uniref:GNAT family N-acetyltransferase n=1 Tax=uncultured Roseibium sp. TaxID=1936171 RepID=UPI00261681F1|nr:GNAT family N-acetyltransferase [uncultured Roseibium sp.]